MPSESTWIIFEVEDYLIRCFKKKEPKTGFEDGREAK